VRLKKLSQNKRQFEENKKRIKGKCLPPISSPVMNEINSFGE